jgi:hypothetical protein
MPAHVRHRCQLSKPIMAAAVNEDFASHSAFNRTRSLTEAISEHCSDYCGHIGRKTNLKASFDKVRR